MKLVQSLVVAVVVGGSIGFAQSTTPVTPPAATVPITSQTPAGAVDSTPAAAVPTKKNKKKQKKVPKDERPVAYANNAKANNAAYEKQKADAAAKKDSTTNATPNR